MPIYVWDNGYSEPRDHSIFFYECPLGPDDVIPFLNGIHNGTTVAVLGNLIKNMGLNIEIMWVALFHEITKTKGAMSPKLLDYFFVNWKLNPNELKMKGLSRSIWEQRFENAYRQRLSSTNSASTEMANAAFLGDEAALHALHDSLLGDD